MAKKGLKIFSTAKRRARKEAKEAPEAGGGRKRGKKEREIPEQGPVPSPPPLSEAEDEELWAQEERDRLEEEEEQRKVALIEARRFQARQAKVLEDEARPLLSGLLANPAVDPSKWDPTDLAHLAIQLAVALRAAAEETVASVPPPQEPDPEDEILF